MLCEAGLGRLCDFHDLILLLFLSFGAGFVFWIMLDIRGWLFVTLVRGFFFAVLFMPPKMNVCIWEPCPVFGSALCKKLWRV